MIFFFLSSNEIKVYNGNYEYQSQYSGTYSFNKQSEYLMHSEFYAQGIWHGNGKIRITILSVITCNQKQNIFHCTYLIYIFILI